MNEMTTLCKNYLHDCTLFVMVQVVAGAAAVAAAGVPSSTWFLIRRNLSTGSRYSLMVSLTPFSSKYPSVSISVFSFPATASIDVCKKRRLTSTEPCCGGRKMENVR